MRRFIEKIWTTEPKLVKLVDNPTIEQTYEIEEGYKYISILACAAGGNGGPGGYGNAGGGGGSGSLGLLKNLLLSPKTKKQISYKLGTPGTNLRLAPFTGYLNKIYVLTCGVNGDGSAAHDGGGYGGGWKPEMTGDDTYLLQNGTELLFDVSTMTGGGGGTKYADSSGYAGKGSAVGVESFPALSPPNPTFVVKDDPLSGQDGADTGKPGGLGGKSYTWKAGIIPSVFGELGKGGMAYNTNFTGAGGGGGGGIGPGGAGGYQYNPAGSTVSVAPIAGKEGGGGGGCNGLSGSGASGGNGVILIYYHNRQI